MENLKDTVMTDEEFDLLRDLILRNFGILIRGDKRLTLHTKVSHRLSILGLSSYREYCDFIMRDSSREELGMLASRITNNETYFFREKPQLDILSELLKTVKKEKQRKEQNKISLLSLACSSGEEAYTLNIILIESALFTWNWDIRITGIDIDRAAIDKARAACYTRNSFRGLNGGGLDVMKKYFRTTFDAESTQYCLKKPYMQNVDFKYGNILSAGTFDHLHGADLIFCRNLLIYMSDDALKTVIRNCYNTLADDGYLFVGTSESLIQRTDIFVPQYLNGIIVYRKKCQK